MSRQSSAFHTAIRVFFMKLKNLRSCKGPPRACPSIVDQSPSASLGVGRQPHGAVQPAIWTGQEYICGNTEEFQTGLSAAPLSNRSLLGPLQGVRESSDSIDELVKRNIQEVLQAVQQDDEPGAACMASLHVAWAALASHCFHAGGGPATRGRLTSPQHPLACICRDATAVCGRQAGREHSRDKQVRGRQGGCSSDLEDGGAWSTHRLQPEPNLRNTCLAHAGPHLQGHHDQPQAQKGSQ